MGLLLSIITPLPYLKKYQEKVVGLISGYAYCPGLQPRAADLSELTEKVLLRFYCF